MSRPVNNLVNQKFGRLTVIAQTALRRNNHVIWQCRCECGNISMVRGTDLTRGKHQSCGCAQHIGKVHGKSYSPLYRIWHNMKQRAMASCYEYTWRRFPDSEQWALSHGYNDSMRLIRISRYKNWTPANCRWILKLNSERK